MVRRAVEKGDLLKVDFGPSVGHEQQGYRPVLVVSSTRFNTATGFMWVLPITSHVKGRRDEIFLPEGLPVFGVLLFSQIKAMDISARTFSKVGSVSEDFMDTEVSGRLIAILED